MGPPCHRPFNVLHVSPFAQALFSDCALCRCGSTGGVPSHLHILAGLCYKNPEMRRESGFLPSVLEFRIQQRINIIPVVTRPGRLLLLLLLDAISVDGGQ